MFAPQAVQQPIREQAPAHSRQTAEGSTHGLTPTEPVRGPVPFLQRYLGNSALQSRVTGSATPPASAVPPVVHDVVRSPSQPLDPTTRTDMESRFHADFSQVRVHTDTQAAESAQAVGALAYTVGSDIVFGSGAYCPGTPQGQHRIAHELAHTLQQSKALGGQRTPMKISHPRDPAEREADRAATAAGEGRLPAILNWTGPQIARQPKPPAKADSEQKVVEDIPPKDTMAGTMVSQIIISLVRKRVGFQTALGMILGDVNTDLKPGTYKLQPDVAHQEWRILEPATKEGFRFTVTLEGANPWTLSYPEKLDLLVAPGSLTEPKTFGDMTNPKVGLIDPLWLYEGMPPEMKPKPLAGIDDFESIRYDLSYRSEGGNLSKWITVYYRDNTTRDINIDTITEATPGLWAVKQEALKVMGEYNLMGIIQVFPTVWFVLTINPLTINPTVSAPKGGFRYTVSRRTVQRPSGGSAPQQKVVPKQEGGPKQEPVPHQKPVAPSPKSNEPASARPVGEVGKAATHTPTAPLTRPRQSSATPASTPSVEAPPHPMQTRALELVERLTKEGHPIIANLGGAGASHEPANAINVNNQAVGRKGIPNLVEADGSDIGMLFKPATLDRIEGHNMASEAIDWSRAAPGAYKTLKPGGTLYYYYRGFGSDARFAGEQLRKAGFKDVQVIEDVIIQATKP